MGLAVLVKRWRCNSAQRPEIETGVFRGEMKLLPTKYRRTFTITGVVSDKPGGRNWKVGKMGPGETLNIPTGPASQTLLLNRGAVFGHAVLRRSRRWCDPIGLEYYACLIRIKRNISGSESADLTWMRGGVEHRGQPVGV